MIRVIVEEDMAADDPLVAMVSITFATEVGTLSVPHGEAERYIRSLKADGDIVLTDLRRPQDGEITPP